MGNAEFKKKNCEKFTHRRGHRQPRLLRLNVTVYVLYYFSFLVMKLESTNVHSVINYGRSKANLISHKKKCDELYDSETRTMKIKCRHCPQKFSKNGKKTRSRHEEKCPVSIFFFISY